MLLSGPCVFEAGSGVAQTVLQHDSRSIFYHLLSAPSFYCAYSPAEYKGQPNCQMWCDPIGRPQRIRPTIQLN